MWEDILNMGVYDALSLHGAIKYDKYLNWHRVSSCTYLHQWIILPNTCWKMFILPLSSTMIYSYPPHYDVVSLYANIKKTFGFGSDYNYSSVLYVFILCIFGKLLLSKHINVLLINLSRQIVLLGLLFLNN